MSGFGIREQWQAGRQLSGHSSQPLWRPASFLHQLSLSGSMLLVANHDRYWLAELARAMGQEGRGWRSLSRRLRLMPGADARRYLWRASYAWFDKQVKAYPEQSLLAFRVLSGRPEILRDKERELRRVAAQLRALAWCEFDVDRSPISIVDLEAAANSDAA